ncbi:MAG: hypothetical protein AAGU21_10505 [Solidesulfovibrio sp.]|uniref:hypothetical protein n=1 Tax=Solidesulfovibrio sp. TaxID=2910990 RepID=UPI003159297A
MQARFIFRVIPGLRGKRFGWSAGSSLLWAIGALVVMGAVGAGVALMTPATMQSKLQQEAGMRAYYNANAGLNFVMTMRSVAQNEGISFSDYISNMGSGSLVTYGMENDGYFAFQFGNINGTNNTYQVNSLYGVVTNSSGGAAYNYVIYGGGKGSGSVMNYNVASSAQKGLYNKVEVYSGLGLTIGSDAVLDSDVMAANVAIGNNANISGNVVGNTFVKTSGYVTINGDVCSNGYVETSNASTYKANIDAQGYVTIASNVKVYGSVFAEDYVTVGNAAIVSGDINSGNYVYLTGGTSPSSQVSNVKADGDITLNSSAIIGSNAYANIRNSTKAKIDMGYASKMSNAYAMGNIAVGGSAVVSSIACCGGTLTKGWAASVGSVCSTFSDSYIVKRTAPTACTILAAPKHADAANFPSTGTNVTASSGGATLTPGTVYGTVSSSNEGVLYLTSGIYYINTLTLTGNKTKMYLDVTNGDITIFVTKSITLSNLFSVYITGKDNVTSHTVTKATVGELISGGNTGIAAKVYLETMGTFTFANQNTWIGTIYADGNINLGYKPTILGALYSKSGTVVEVNSQSLYFVMSNYAKDNWVAGD